MLNKKSVTVLAVLLTGCSSMSPSYDARQSYHDLGNAKPDKLSISAIRHQALRDSALSLGARAGLAWRAENINQQVMKHQATLDRIFSFNSMMLENYVLPPVLIEARQSFDLNSNDTIRIADRQYVIQEQARFVSTPPSWRDYLVLQFKQPENPDRSLLPRNNIEKKVWDHFIDEGWQAGITQADSIFQEQVGRIKRDMNGMILYRTLLAKNMVTPPFVAEVNFGITGGDNQMSVNDRVLHITAMPSLNAKSEDWETDITKPRG